MRNAIVLVATAALSVTLVDFFVNTRARLQDQSRLRAEIVALQADDRERLKSPEVPPSESRLQEWQKAAESSRQVAGRGEEIWFAGADDTWDYLLEDAAERPLPPDAARIRELLRTRLIYLQSRLGHLADRGAGLGIRFPTATQGLSSELDELRDQSERAALLDWILETLGEDGELESLEMSRNEDGRLEAELEMRAVTPLVLDFFEAFLRPSEAVAPRRVRGWNLAVIPAASWGPEIDALDSPPVCLQLSVVLERPTLDRGPRATEETGP